MRKNIFVLLCALVIVSAIYVFGTMTYAVLVKKQTKTVVVIDVGHGGKDPGKVSVDGIKEKDVNLQIAKYLKDYLIAQDFAVYLDRETDCDLSDSGVSNMKTSDMKNRIDFFDEKAADYVISIHQNSYPDASCHGAQVFYYSGSETGKEMANEIQSNLLSFDPTNKRVAKDSSDYYILRKSKVPTVIVECGFLSNPTETSHLTDGSYQKDLAYSICMGFCRFYQTR